MQIVRRTENLQLGKHSWTLRSLVPADFLSSEGWPFQFYSLAGERPAAPRKWINDGGPKPRWLLEGEARVNKILALGIIDPILTAAEIDLLNESAKNLFVGAIFALSYGLDLNPSELRELNRTHLEEISIKARMRSSEPWETTFGDDEIPEGLNPKRHDFNNLVFTVGFERDKKLSEQARSRL